MFVLIIKEEEDRGWFGNKDYVEKREDGKLYLSDLQNAKTFETEEEAKEWAGASILQFDVEKIENNE